MPIQLGNCWDFDWGDTRIVSLGFGGFMFLHANVSLKSQEYFPPHILL
jgi:hypothetical protein